MCERISANLLNFVHAKLRARQTAGGADVFNRRAGNRLAFFKSGSAGQFLPPLFHTRRRIILNRRTLLFILTARPRRRNHRNWTMPASQKFRARKSRNGWQSTTVMR